MYDRFTAINICCYIKVVWAHCWNKFTFHENVFLTLSDYVVTTSPGVEKITSSARKVTTFYRRKLHVLKTFWGRFCASWDKPKIYFKNGMKLHTDKQVFTGFYVCVYICSKRFFLDKEPCSKADHASFWRRKIVRVYEQFLYLCGALDTMLSSLCVRTWVR
jgi:hypothetical protein